VKRYTFRLDAVLRVRQVEEERARGDLALANRALADAEARLERRIEHYGETPQPSQPLPASAFLAVRDRQEWAARSVVVAGTARIVADGEVTSRRHDWSAAVTRLAALERLDERRREEHRLEAQRQEALEVDDIVVARSRRAVR
jgi:flagellar export protein FliJ